MVFNQHLTASCASRRVTLYDGFLLHLSTISFLIYLLVSNLKNIIMAYFK